MAKRLTTTANMILEDGTVKKFDELTPEELSRFKENARQRLSHSMSLYFTQHKEEFLKV